MQNNILLLFVLSLYMDFLLDFLLFIQVLHNLL